jgi:two-component system chemotaxis response regulator CheB
MNFQAREASSAAQSAVAIGASAGGVDALLALLPNLPAGFAAAVIVVLHVPAARSSALPQLLARVCQLPVKEAEDKETLLAGHIYIAPGGYHLLVEPDRSLSFSLDAPVNYARPAIDVLFESAALAYEARLLAIVLTGANADGAAGLAAVKAQGGQGWVQDPREAQASTMPEAAIATGCAELVLPLKDLGQRLATWRALGEEHYP